MPQKPLAPDGPLAAIQSKLLATERSIGQMCFDFMLLKRELVTASRVPPPSHVSSELVPNAASREPLPPDGGNPDDYKFLPPSFDTVGYDPNA